MRLLHSGLHDDRCTHLLESNPDPTDDEIRHALSGNLCRCTGYVQMYQAIKDAIEAERKGLALEAKS